MNINKAQQILINLIAGASIPLYRRHYYRYSSILLQLVRNFSKIVLRNLLLHLSQSSSKNINEENFRVVHVLQFVLKHPKKIRSYIKASILNLLLKLITMVTLGSTSCNIYFHTLEEKFLN